MSTTTLRRIDERLQELDPQSLRYRVLVSLRRFRASWVELGRLLSEVQVGGDYKEWGYDDFEVYCAGELGLKKPTVKKLINSYRYMQRSVPERLHAWDEYDGQGTPPEMPEYQTVDLVRQAQEREDLDEDQKQHFHRLAFDEGAEETALRKEIRGAISAADEGADDATVQRRRELADIKRTCQVLRRKLADSRCVPEGLRERFDRLLAELQAVE
jgi:hypothetical protein